MKAPARTLSASEVAALLGFSRWTVQRLVASGSFPKPIRMSGTNGRPRWYAPTVEAWLASLDRSANQ